MATFNISNNKIDLMRKQLLLAVAFLLFCGYTARGQSIGTRTVNVAGASTTVNNQVHEWSVGEMALINTFSSSTLTVTQGVLQPVDFPTDVPYVRLDEQLDVYPNPATATVYLKYNLVNRGTLAYVLTDIAGKKLKEHTIEGKVVAGTEAIDLSAYADGSYMLNVVYTGGLQPETVSFKIQKIN